MSSRTQRVPDTATLERTVERYVTEQGYTVTDSNAARVTLKESGLGSIWWHILLLLTTAGFGNALYVVYTLIKRDVVTIRVDESLPREAGAYGAGGETA